MIEAVAYKSSVQNVAIVMLVRPDQNEFQYRDRASVNWPSLARRLEAGETTGLQLHQQDYESTATLVKTQAISDNLLPWVSFVVSVWMQELCKIKVKTLMEN